MPPVTARLPGRRSAARLALALGAAWLGLAPAGSSADLQVGAASSLREPLEECARAYEAARPGTRVRVSYGASSVIAAQLRAGAPLDLVLLADEAIALSLAEGGHVERPRSLAHNRLVVLVREGGPELRGPAGLARETVHRVAVPEHAVPVGRYAREWLRDHGLLEALTPRLVSTEHARATLLAVDQGLVDAAIVYATDARLARRARVAWEIPDPEQPRIAYALALARAERSPDADGFARFLLGERGAAILAQHGFAPGSAP